MPMAEAAEDLLAKLRASSDRVIDFFKRWDEDMSGEIDKKEFRDGIAALTAKQDLEPVPKEGVAALFKLLDADGSGKIDLKELNKMLRIGVTTEIAKELQAGREASCKIGAASARAKRKIRRST